MPASKNKKKLPGPVKKADAKDKSSSKGSKASSDSSKNSTNKSKDDESKMSSMKKEIKKGSTEKKSPATTKQSLKTSKNVEEMLNPSETNENDTYVSCADSCGENEQLISTKPTINQQTKVREETPLVYAEKISKSEYEELNNSVTE